MSNLICDYCKQKVMGLTTDMTHNKAYCLKKKCQEAYMKDVKRIKKEL